MPQANVAPGRRVHLSPADGHYAYGILRICVAMRQLRRGGAARDQLMEMALVPMALHGPARLGPGVRHLSRWSLARLDVISRHERNSPFGQNQVHQPTRVAEAGDDGGYCRDACLDTEHRHIRDPPSWLFTEPSG